MLSFVKFEVGDVSFQYLSNTVVFIWSLPLFKVHCIAYLFGNPNFLESTTFFNKLQFTMQKYRSANLVLNFDICAGDGLSNMESAVQNCIAVSSLVSNYSFHLKVKSSCQVFYLLKILSSFSVAEIVIVVVIG